MKIEFLFWIMTCYMHILFIVGNQFYFDILLIDISIENYILKKKLFVPLI